MQHANKNSIPQNVKWIYVKTNCYTIIRKPYISTSSASPKPFSHVSLSGLNKKAGWGREGWMRTGGRREAAERGRESTQHPDILYGTENSYIGNSLGTCTLCSITSYLYYFIIPPPLYFYIYSSLCSKVLLHWSSQEHAVVAHLSPQS